MRTQFNHRLLHPPSIDGLEQHGAIISQAIANSSETPGVKYAQRKLIKRQERARRTEEGALNHTRGVMERDPLVVLTSSLDYARAALDDLLDKTCEDFLTEKIRMRKRKGREGAAGATGTVPATGAGTAPADIVDPPQLMAGALAYSPLEAVAYIRHVRERVPANKAYLRAYKDKMIAAGLVPVRKCQLDTLVREYGGPDGPMAPL